MSANASPRQPVVFVSHGAPDALLKSPEVVRCWEEIGRAMDEPRAILAVSAHWETRVPTASLCGAPDTIHDFAGFAPALHQMRYPAPGAPALAERVARLLGTHGIAAELHPNRGLDHGAWVPLTAMFPPAHLPATQLSVARLPPAAHFAIGQALAPLRDEGVLIVASGAITHNFAWIDWRAADGAPPLPRARAFADWVADRLERGETSEMLAYRDRTEGAAAHPTEEHLLPLFVAMGAGGAPPVHHRPPFAYGGLAMDAYVWN
jgi:4,5-DOPA dioxygenase extradiol